MSAYETSVEALRQEPRRWLVTGAAGFIGSNLVEALLQLGQRVTGLDNFSTGHRRNLEQIQQSVAPELWQQFAMIEGDVADLKTCRRALVGIDYVSHQAAMASVPQSIEQPLACHAVNVTGSLNLLVAASEAKVRRFVFASTCAVYGDHPELPKRETSPVRCLSPYALTKLMDELYADFWGRFYGCESVGLRYFNVFGPRQDPQGAYAAVIPKWIEAMMQGREVTIFGDGESTRDFCYVANVVQANILAATTSNPEAVNQVYNVAVNSRTSLNALFSALQERLAHHYPKVSELKPNYRDFRSGDVRHSEAAITKAEKLLGYKPSHRVEDGLDDALQWYLRHLG